MEREKIRKNNNKNCKSFDATISCVVGSPHFSFCRSLWADSRSLMREKYKQIEFVSKVKTKITMRDQD